MNELVTNAPLFEEKKGPILLVSVVNPRSFRCVLIICPYNDCPYNPINLAWILASMKWSHFPSLSWCTRGDEWCICGSWLPCHNYIFNTMDSISSECGVSILLNHSYNTSMPFWRFLCLYFLCVLEGVIAILLEDDTWDNVFIFYSDHLSIILIPIGKKPVINFDVHICFVFILKTLLFDWIPNVLRCIPPIFSG